LKREARQKRKAGETEVVLHELREDFMDMDEDDLELMFDKPLPTASAQGTGKKGIPYDELDANIVKLVQALNRYPGVMTVGSCGGHEIYHQSLAVASWNMVCEIQSAIREIRLVSAGAPRLGHQRGLSRCRQKRHPAPDICTAIFEYTRSMPVLRH
jgi:hypothetical protein